jgi:hypothetical protein
MQKINISGLIIHVLAVYAFIQAHYIPGTTFVPHFEPLHFIPLSFYAFTSAPHSFGKYSFPFRKLIHSVFPKPFSYANPMVYIYFCDELAPKGLIPYGRAEKELFNLDYNWRLSRE